MSRTIVVTCFARTSWSTEFVSTSGGTPRSRSGASRRARCTTAAGTARCSRPRRGTRSRSAPATSSSRRSVPNGSSRTFSPRPMQLLYRLVVKSVGTSGVRDQAPHERFGSDRERPRGPAARSGAIVGRRLDAAQSAVITAAAERGEDHQPHRHRLLEERLGGEPGARVEDEELASRSPSATTRAQRRPRRGSHREPASAGRALRRSHAKRATISEEREPEVGAALGVVGGEVRRDARRPPAAEARHRRDDEVEQVGDEGVRARSGRGTRALSRRSRGRAR